MQQFLVDRTLSRRSLIAGAAALAASMALGRDGARAGFAVHATIAGDSAVDLKSKPSQKRKTVGTIPPATVVSLIDGPTESGWYKVQTSDGVTGWLPAGSLEFSHRAKVTWDQTLFDAPGGGNAIDWVRHGIVVTLVGSPTGGFALVRYGETTGYLDLTGVETTDAGATNPQAEHWIDVNRNNGAVSLFIGETCVDQFWASLSRDQGDGFYATACGTYAIYDLDPGLSYTPYADAYIMYWAGFDPERNNGFHSWTMDWQGWVLPDGNGPTAGCVSTAPEIAAQIYNFCWMGMRVEIHW